VFDTVAVTTKGGPGNASRVIQIYIYDRAFARSDFGYAAAMSVILFILLAAIAWAQNRYLRGGESDLA
jgi:multiple sugar transport system permease protein